MFECLCNYCLDMCICFSRRYSIVCMASFHFNDTVQTDIDNSVLDSVYLSLENILQVSTSLTHQNPHLRELLGRYTHLHFMERGELISVA